MPLEEDIFFDDEDIISNFSSTNQTRQLLGYSLDFIPQNYLTKTHTNNLFDIFRSQSPNMYVSGNSGSLTSGNYMMLRGNQTFFGKSSPTIYLDGIKYDADNVSGGFNTGGQTISRLNDINIYDIERIEVLKGSASTAIYGSEGANGVIQIFTKNGYPGQRRIQLYAKPTISSRGSISAPNLSTELLIDEQQNSLLLLNNIGAAIRGGQQDHRYYLSINYHGNNGVIDQEKIDGINLKSNFKFVMNSQTEFNVKSGYSRSLTNRAFGENSSAGPYSSSLTLDDQLTGSERTHLQSTKLQQEVSKYNTSLNFVINTDAETRINGIIGFDITDQQDALEFNSFGNDSNIFQSNNRLLRTFSSRLSYFKLLELNPDTKLDILFGANYNSTTINRALNATIGELPPLYTLEENSFMTPLNDYNLRTQTLGVYAKAIATLKKNMSIEAGARFDKSKFSNFDYSNIFPFASFNYIHAFSKNEYIKGFASFGTSGRMLNNHESINYINYQNDKLETNSEIEIGAEYKFMKGKFKSRLSFFSTTTTNGYVMNLLDETNRSITSDGEISSSGIEFSIAGYTYREDDLSHFTQIGFTSSSTTVNNTGSGDIVLGAFRNLPDGGNAIFTKNGAGLEFYLPTVTDGTANTSIKAGNILPTFYGSFNNYFKYKKFSLDLISNFAYGHKVLNLTKNYRDHLGLTNTSKENLFLADDIEDAGWFKIREIILSYHLEMGANQENNVTLSLSIQNAFIFSNYSGDDPEANAFTFGSFTNSGIDFQSIPSTRVYSLRLMLDI